MDGVVILDKPAGWTSHDAVNKLRRLAGTSKVGHLGTLDPMATGVLPLVIGRATRLAQFYTKAEKSYVASVRFGWSTSTYDADGEPVSPATSPAFSREDLEEWLSRFRGVFAQTPPPISAKKIGGTPAYKLARRNIPVEIPPVEVTITRVEVTDFSLPEVRLEIDCGSGTYIRSLAHDLGQLAGCGAHVASLRRTRSGDFFVQDSRTMEQLIALAEAGRFEEAVVPAAALLPSLPSESVDALTASQIRQGRDFRVSPFRDRGNARYVKAIDPEGALVAIGEATVPNVYHPVLVF
jgi:tRNA pseudouridine55 synthase